MFELRLFLGFTPDESFQKALQKTNPHLVTLLIGKEEYLQEIVQSGQRYLGKFLSFYPTVDQLHDLEKHLLSLLQKLVPTYSFHHNPPQLITVHGS